MARISDDDLERLKRNSSIEELCRARGIELKPHGRKDLIGKCPFHEEDNPSFIVTPDKNLFHCMGCDAAGSVIDLVMKLDRIEFRAAVDKLLPGMRSGSHADRPEKQAPAITPEKARQLLERVIELYAGTFTDPAGSGTGHSAGRAYLEGRGITDAGLFTQYRIGYSNGRLKEILPTAGPVWGELKALGVLLPNPSRGSGQACEERFAGCVVFPVFDVDGNITTLYGRFTGPEPKRHLFLPDRSTGLWNAVAMKTYSEIILVESVIDALSVMMAGHRNVIAIQGTNGLGEADIRLMTGNGVRKITLLLDGDEAGAKACDRLRPMLEAEGMEVRVKALPAEQDPNSYMMQQGAGKLAEFIASEAWTPNEMKYFQQPPVTRGPGETPEAGPDSPPTVPARGGSSQQEGLTVAYGMRKYRIMGLEKGPRKLKATLRVEHAGKLHVDTLDFYSARSRRILAMDLCRIFEETSETIEADIEKLLRHCETLPETSGVPEPRTQNPEHTISPRDRAEAEAFGKSPTLFDDILADCEKSGLMGERNNVHLLYVAMTSRKRDTPLSVLILSSSGAGKTALQDAICAFCPPEDLVKLTSLSGKALFYKERLSLKHKVLALEEGDGAGEAMYAIRNLISAGELVSESTIKDIATGRLTTMENKVEGPSSVCFTTTNPEVDPETKSRFWVTSIDESRDQTRKILLFQRQQHLSDGPIASPEIDAILRKHRNFQRLLKPLAVKNPYAAQLSYGDDRLQGRRDQPKYLNLIKAIAFLRQMQKEVKRFTGSAAAGSPAAAGTPMEYIEVDQDDIELANRLAHEILGHSLDELSRPGHDLLMLLEELAKERLKTQLKENPDSKTKPTDFSFSRRDIREFTGWTNTRLHIHLKELVDFEYIAIETGRNGMPFRYRLAWEGQGKDGRRFVLGLKKVEDLKQPLNCEPLNQ